MQERYFGIIPEALDEQVKPDWFARHERIWETMVNTTPILDEESSQLAFGRLRIYGQRIPIYGSIYQDRYEIVADGRLVYECSEEMDWDTIHARVHFDCPGSWEGDVVRLQEMVAIHDELVAKRHVRLAVNPYFTTAFETVAWRFHSRQQMRSVDSDECPF